MDTRQELLLGKLAVAERIVSKDQLKHCLHLQKQNGLPLAKILLKQKLLDQSNLPGLLLKYFQEIGERGLKEPGEDLVLCRLLQKRKNISSAMIGALITAYQMSPEISIGELILRESYLEPRELVEIYVNLGNETLSCPGCEKQFRLVRLAPGKKLRCKNCKTVFHVPTFEHEAGPYSKRIALAQQSKAKCYGEYEVLSEIAEGGMGIIYRAQKKATGQVVALKVLRETHRSSHEAKERFKREAWMLKQKLAGHKNIVTVYDVGFANEVPYFAMEFIEGRPLSEVIEYARLPLEQVLEIVIAICDGIHFAHGKGIIHRDLKPSNILLTADQEPKITDFGLAKCVDSMTMVTRTGAMLGTPYYMSPEQAKGQLGLVGPRSDIYSLGVIFYELLTGHKPFTGETAVEIYHNILVTAPHPPSKIAHLPRQLDKICLKCLEKNPFHRYKTAEDFAAELRNFQRKKGSWWNRLSRRFRK